MTKSKVANEKRLMLLFVGEKEVCDESVVNNPQTRMRGE